MAVKNPAPRRPQTVFQVIEPLFYKEFNRHPSFPEWTFARMPRNIDISKLVFNKKQKSGEWLYAFYNTKGRFRCQAAECDREKDDDTWSSVYTTILFRAYYGPDTDEFGQAWIGGWIQMCKIYWQNCKSCETRITPILDQERPKRLVEWLHRWIAKEFYGFHFPRSYLGKNTLSNGPHDRDRCEACRTGVCSYIKRSKQQESLLKKERRGNLE